MSMSMNISMSWQSVTLLSGSLLLGNTLAPAPVAAQLTLTDEDCIAGSVVAGGFGYSACRGAFYGNDAQASGEPLLSELNNGLFADVVGNANWSYYGKSDEGIFTADNTSSGLWNLLPGEVLNSPFVLSLKASTGFSAYLFTNITEVTGGSFNTAGVATNQRDIPQDLSHASIYLLDNGTQPQAVPFDLSSSLGLLSLAGIFGVSRFKGKGKSIKTFLNTERTD